MKCMVALLISITLSATALAAPAPKIITLYVADMETDGDPLSNPFISECSKKGPELGFDFRFVDSLDRREQNKIYDYRVILSGHHARGVARARGDISVF